MYFNVNLFLYFFLLIVLRDLCETIENVWLQVKSVIEKELNKIQKTLPIETENTIKHQILQLTERNSAVRTLFCMHF